MSYDTHGLRFVSKDVDKIEWLGDALSLMIPGIKSRGADYNDRDREQEINNKGRMSGDLSDIDWDEWTQNKMFTEIRYRCWGGVARNRIRKLGTLRQYKIRVCEECGEMLRVYDGTDDSIGSYVRYIQDTDVRCFANDYERVMAVYQQFKADLKQEGKNIVDFAAMIPLAVSAFEFGLKQSKDIILDSPFQEPDEFFLRRQRKAFGE